MKKIITLCCVLLGNVIFAQNKALYSANEQQAIQVMSKEIAKKQSDNYDKALVVAQKKNWQISGEYKDGRRFQLKGIDDTGQPLYLITHSNAKSSAASRTNTLYSGGSLGLNLNGGSSFMTGKLGIWDGGRVYASHVELVNRVSQQDNPTSTDQHATHVSGTMIASGISAQAKGMAFGASLKAWDYNNDNTEMANAATGLLVSNHSYGYLAGWNYDSSISKWRWMGNTSINAFEDYKFGFYDTETQTWDRISYNAPYYLIVKSAGNNRGETGPTSTSEVYYIGNGSDTSTVARSKNNSYDIISTTGNAKNILTVGAVNTLDSPPTQASDIKISSFSSWGPTDDGRIKPDIVGVGVNIFSTSNTSTTSYTTLSGTSMSSPHVAGSLFLLQELYAQQNDGLFMRSATLKGLAIHTAEDAGNAGPDYIYGWGLLNMEKAAIAILNKDFTHSITERTLAQGGSFSQKVVASGKGALRATISWTDPAATASSVTVANFNNRTPKLVNDLDIRISDDETNTFLPFVLNPDKPSDVATNGDNIRDNIEQILIPNPIPGKTYTITISHKGTLTNSSQNYSLIISGLGGKSYCAITPSTAADYLDTLNLGTNSVSTGQIVQLDIKFKDTSSKNIRAFVDWNLDGDFDDANESILSLQGYTSSTYSGKVTIPQGIEIGNTTILRVICSDANSTIASSCGTIAKGEVMEIPLKIVRPMYDLAVSELISPESTLFCSNTAYNQVSVSIRNIGSENISNIPITVKVANSSGTVVATLNGTYSGTLSSLQSGTAVLSGTFNAIAGETYTFATEATLSTDQDNSNNIATFSRKVASPVAPSAQAVLCEGASSLVIKSSSSSSLLWYDQLLGGNLLFTGGSGSFTTPTNTQKVYVTSGDLSGSIGAKSKYTFGGGTYYDSFGPEIIMTTQLPIVLKSARVYVGTAGTIKFSITRMSDGTPISSVTVNVNATRTTANSTRSNNQLIDDKTDQGIVIPLNLKIPEAGTYLISQDCTDGASIFRSNKNADTTKTGDLVGYPFVINSAVSITGALYEGSTIKTGYYYLYDIDVSSLECPSPRAEVAIQTITAPQVSITPTNTVSFCPDATATLTASSNSNYAYQWLRNGTKITGATRNTYTISTAGSYSVNVVDNGLCSVTSSAVVATALSPIAPVLSWSGSNLTLQSGNSPTWYVNGNELAIAKGLANIVPIQSGYYNAKVLDANGCTAYSNGVTITITAVEEEPLSDGIAKVFPNPTSGKITVKFPNSTGLKSVQAQLINFFGMVLETKDLEKQSDAYTTSFDLASLGAGSYFVRITADNQVKVLKVSLNQ